MYQGVAAVTIRDFFVASCANNNPESDPANTITAAVLHITVQPTLLTKLPPCALYKQEK
jgi:hypothetical protein